MQEFRAASRSNAGAGNAGLLVLYADNNAQLPAGYALPESDVSVGREAPATVQIPVSAISRLHATLSRERGGYRITDCGSTNGTLLDGRRVLSARLEDNQELRLGDAILKFIPSDFAAYQRYRLDGRLEPGARRLSPPDSELIGGYQMDRIGGELSKIARSTLSVMLLGESGTGKEVAARQLHRWSQRRGRFCAINCAAIPQNLIESELFGYKRGAFSGADRDKPGLIQAADGGTLLLDEIGDMPAAAQAKLLRVLQAKEVFPVGATRAESVDVRVVCATHRDLTQLQAEDRFRADLFARLNEYQVRLPPLRDRKEDVYLLLKTLFARHGRAEMEPTFSTMTALLHYDWPYNVRELEACAKRAVALTSGASMTVELLPDALSDAMLDYGSRTPSEADLSSEGTSRAPTREELITLLRVHSGNVAAVGRELGKARMQVHRWLKRYDLTLADFR